MSAENLEFDLKLVYAEWLLGLVTSDDLPDIAIRAISSGIESGSILRLASLAKTESMEAVKLFDRGLMELGYKAITKVDALRIYATEVSRLILEERLSPLEGARLIWRAKLNSGNDDFHELDGFIYAASEMEERPNDKRLFEKAIFEESRRWAKHCG